MSNCCAVTASGTTGAGRPGAGGEGGVRTDATAETASVFRELRARDPLVARSREAGCPIRRTALDSEHAGTALRSFVVEAVDAAAGKKPGLLLLHTAVGVHDSFVHYLSERYAASGFVVLVHDMYGREAATRAWEPGECGRRSGG